MTYQFYQQGAFLQLQGRLGKDLQVEKTKNGNRYLKFSIAVSAGTAKDEGGNWQSLTNWYSIIIWDKGGNSSLLLDVIEKPPSEKLFFAKGNLVDFRGVVIVSSRVYEGKVYVEYTCNNFYDLVKVQSSNSSSTQDSSSKVLSNEIPDDF